MTIERAAVGTESLYGFAPEEPSPSSNVGHPRPNVHVVTPPASTITGAAASGTGNLTGTFAYRQFFIAEGGFRTNAGPASAPVTVTAKDIDLTGLEAAVDSAITAWGVERTSDGGTTYAVIGYSWDPSATTWTDTLAKDSPFIDKRDASPVLNETGVNGGFKFFSPETADFKTSYSVLETKENVGTAGKARGVPGPAKFDHTMKDAATLGGLVPILASLINTPTKYGVASGSFAATGPFDEPTKKFVFTPPRAGQWNPFSMSLQSYKGGSPAPEFHWQNMASELDIVTAGGKVVEATAKLVGCWHSKCGLATATLISGGTTYATVPVCFGIRQDSNRATKAMVFKVQSAPTAGSFKVRAKNDPAASYTSSGEMTVYYDTTSKKQMRGGTNETAKVEVYQQNGLRVGLGDTGEGRRPFMILFGADVTQLEVGDEFSVPVVGLIPDIGSTPGTPDGTYTGFPPKRLVTPRFAAGHVTFLMGASAADTPLLIDSATLKIVKAKSVYMPEGKEADFGVDIDSPGEAMATLTVARRYINRVFEDYLERDGRLYGGFSLEGERIPITPGDPATSGVLSAFRESLLVAGTTWRVSSTASPTSGAGITEESIVFEAEQPADYTLPPFDATAVTREDQVFYS